MRPYTIVLPLLFTFIALAPAPAARGHGHEDREPREVRESHEQRDLDRDIRDAERRQLDAAREQEKASPLSGAWSGPSDAFERMEVSVQVMSV